MKHGRTIGVGARKRRMLAIEHTHNARRTRQTVARPARAWQPPPVEVFTLNSDRRDFRTGETMSAFARATRNAMLGVFRSVRMPRPEPGGRRGRKSRRR